MGFFIFILMIAGLIDQAIESYKPTVKNKQAPLLGNRAQEYEKESAQIEQKALSNRIHSIEWNADTREVKEIQYEEIY